MKLTKKSDRPVTGSEDVIRGVLGSAVNRRAFLKRTGLALGGGALATALPPAMMKRSQAQAKATATGEIVKKKSVCTHCSVGCGVVAEVQGGVWTGQEPDFDSPFNLGGHCAKGAAVREHGHGERRLKYPMKKVAGKWTRVSWDQASTHVPI